MKAETLHDIKKGYAYGMFSGMAWGLDTVLIGLILSQSPFTTVAPLILFGALVCCLFHDGFAFLWLSAYLSGRRKIQLLYSKIKTRDGLFCVLGALLGGPVGMSFYMLAIKNAGASYTAIITSCYPALGTVLAMVFLKEKLSWSAWVGLLICITGIIWLGYSPDSQGISSGFYLGICFAAVSALGWALESVVCAYGMKSGKVDPEMALTIRELSSFLTYAILIIPLFCGGYEGVMVVTQSSAVWWLLGTAFVGVSSYLAWYKSIDIIGASRAISLNVTYSFWAVLFGLLLAGGTFSVRLIVCSLLIIAGVTLAVGKPQDTLKLKTR